MADEMMKPPFQKIIAAKIFGHGNKSAALTFNFLISPFQLFSLSVSHLLPDFPP